MVSHWISVCVSLSLLCFRMKTWVNINGFSPNLVCALILWRSDLGLLMGKFRQSLEELSAGDTPIFSFLDDNLSRYQGILTKLGTWRDIIILCFFFLFFFLFLPWKCGDYCKFLTEALLWGPQQMFFFFEEKKNEYFSDAKSVLSGTVCQSIPFCLQTKNC